MSQTHEFTEPLNPGGIVSDSLTIMTRTPKTIGVAALIPMAVSGIVAMLALGVGFASGAGEDFFEAGDFSAVFLGTFGVALLLVLLVGIASMIVLCGAVARAALDHVNGPGASVDTAMRAGLRHFFPILLITIVVGIVGYLGLILLILPGLYVMGMWWLVVPAVVEEGRGFGALGRSFELTEGYRWPMIGLVLLYALITIIVGALGAVPDIVLGALGTVGLVISAIIDIFVSAFTYGLGIVTSVLAFNRLRQIKEGGGPGVADIFA